MDIFHLQFSRNFDKKLHDLDTATDEPGGV